jgi:hypothetical protein
MINEYLCYYQDLQKKKKKMAIGCAQLKCKRYDNCKVQKMKYLEAITNISLQRYLSST